MATQTSIFTPGPDYHFTVAATTASAVKTLYKNALFAINADQDINITFGTSTAIATPTANNFRIPGGTTAVYDMSNYYDSFKVYNPNTLTINVWYQELQRN